MTERSALPDSLGVMLLRGCVALPHCLVPLYIFEDRYRQMLAGALESDRLFAIAPVSDSDPRPHLGTAGVIRACVKNDDGTSHLIFNGLSRVRFTAWNESLEYPHASITPIASRTGSAERCAALRSEVTTLLKTAGGVFTDFNAEQLCELAPVTPCDVFSDLIGMAVVSDPALRLVLLEECGVERRLEIVVSYLSRLLESAGDEAG